MTACLDLNRRLACLIVCLALASACIPFKGRDILVPDESTASAQYALALKNWEQKQQIPTSQREAVYPYVIAPFEKVIERFPDDQEFTPQAIMTLGNISYTRQHYKEAFRYYERARKGYATEDRVQVYSILRGAMCLEAMGQVLKARERYKECCERYENHPQESVRILAQQAKSLYNRVLEVK